MRGSGYTKLKGRQVQVSLYLPPMQYWALRAATKKTGLSIQHLVRRALDQVVMEVRLAYVVDPKSGLGYFVDPTTGQRSPASRAPGPKGQAAKEGKAG